MYKLVILQGPDKNKTFDLRPGTFLIGRISDCDIHIESEFISKKHATLTVTPDAVLIEDLSSRNGTFVNGMMIQKTKLKPGDRISFQNVILELQRTGEPKHVQRHIKKRELPKEQLKKVFKRPPSKRPSILQTLKPYFEKVTETIEWKYLTLILVFAFVLLSFAVTVPPLMEETQVKLQTEALKRGELVVKRIARDNQKHISLERGELVVDTLKLSTSLARSEERISTLNIIDPKTKRILAPPERLNQMIDSRDATLRGTEVKKLSIQRISSNNILISSPLYVYSRAEDREVVGAVVQAVFNLEGIGLSAGEKMGILARSLIFLFFVGILFYFLLQQFTSAAIQKVYNEIDTAARKGYRHMELKTKFEEISKVIHSVNQVFRRTRELTAQLPEEQRTPDEKSIINSDEMLNQLMEALPDGVAIVNDSYQIININPVFEKIANFHFDVAADQNILDVIKDQELLRNMTHGLGQASQKGSGPVTEEVLVNNKKYELMISASWNPKDEIDYFILNIRNID